MGCNGSKQQQDVATGNTVIPRLFRRKSAVSEGTLSSTSSTATMTTTPATDVADVVVEEDSSKHVDAPPTKEEAEAESSVVDVEETKQNLSCSDHTIVAMGSEAADVDVHETGAAHVDHAGETTVATVSEDEVSEAMVVEENVDVVEKENSTFSTKDDDGESIGKHSIDFKEAMSLEEAEQVEAFHVSENNDAQANERSSKGSSSD